MSTDPDTLDTPTDADSETELHADLPTADPPTAELTSVVVTAEDGPDRRTLYPEGTSGVDRMSTWLTADDDGFVSLDAMR